MSQFSIVTHQLLLHRKKQTYIVAIDFLRQSPKFMQNSDLDIKESSAYNALDKARGYNSREDVYVALARLGFILQCGGGGVDK